MNIYVGNLNYRVKEGDLQQVMEDYGAVAAAKAIAELNGAEYMGRTMVVKEARPRA
ncbi:MAG: hypothetical protein KHY35_18670 [Bacteroides thetaiotaomicron]|uniref:Cyclic nucleotide-binding domain-containing protein n=1 Tax=Bacteroides thetaiotaomicron TaxID=818 RepID=A0A943DS25_BACT4|nr:hypothetical protein [Bacteroides thetaiotaomicron]